MILRLSALAALIALAACVPDVESLKNEQIEADPVPASGHTPVVIENNKGGSVMQAIQRRKELERWGGPVEIRGYCGSACTLFLTIPNACLDRNGTVGFHAPRIPNTTIIPPGVDDVMGSYYRAGVLERWNTEWKHSLKIQKISAREYAALDPQTKFCK